MADVEKTKSVRKIKADNETMQGLLSVFRRCGSERAAKRLMNRLDALMGSPEEVCWLKVHNQPFYFVPALSMLIVDPKRQALEAKAVLEKVGTFQLELMSRKHAIRLFGQEIDRNPLVDSVDSRYLTYSGIDGVTREVGYIQTKDITYGWFDDYSVSWNITDTSVIKLPVYYLNAKERENMPLFLLGRNLNIFKNKDEKIFADLFGFCSKLYRKKALEFSGGVIHMVMGDYESDLAFALDIFDFLKKYNHHIMDIDLSEKAMKKEIKKQEWKIADVEGVLDGLLSCDETRIHMEKYPRSILTDPQSGHWELWAAPHEDGDMISLSESLVARNPVYDALHNRSGVVGIDFGTKSTVVAYRQSRADVLPMRIGSGKYARAASSSDYENPTVMELRDIENFKKAYGKEGGRPLTHWNDLLISHEAYAQLIGDQSRGDAFSNFFSELKQWASDRERQMTLRDAQGIEIALPPYRALQEGDFDPIEIYAYYIGLFINNMIHGIYLRYKLSFPAKMEKEVRDRILASFERGIKKSLPQPVLEDQKCMDIFRFEQGASEPAAYAVCVLQEYGFDPEDGEKIYYGIFDFGGGTTDFDFGIWSGVDDDDNFDYQILRFGGGEDPYLGGENLLGELAYQVFLDNYDRLSKEEIVFTRPYGAKEEIGREWLISQNSQHAHFNSKRLMESLRGVWEGDEEKREEMKGGSMQISLFDRDGNLKNNFDLQVDLEKMDRLIKEKISKGVAQFFRTLVNCFDESGDTLQKIFKMGKMHIFLAGNSCKSPVVFELFKKQIDQIYGDMSQGNEGERWIQVYPPLGTAQADKIQRGELKPDIDEIITDINGGAASADIDRDGTAPSDADADKMALEKIRKPNGKTGVAFGLLDTRVRVMQNESEESKFRYYLGQSRKKKFRCIIDKDKAEYQVWKRFCTASVDSFEIWFTRSAEATSNRLSIGEIGIYSETGFVDEPDAGKSVYIRLCSPTDIEYAVSELSEEEINQQGISGQDVERLTLQEKE